MACHDMKMQLRYHIANSRTIDFAGITMLLERLAEYSRQFPQGLSGFFIKIMQLGCADFWHDHQPEKPRIIYQPYLQ